MLNRRRLSRDCWMSSWRPQKLSRLLKTRMQFLPRKLPSTPSHSYLFRKKTKGWSKRTTTCIFKLSRGRRTLIRPIWSGKVSWGRVKTSHKTCVSWPRRRTQSSLRCKMKTQSCVRSLNVSWKNSICLLKIRSSADLRQRAKFITFSEVPSSNLRLARTLEKTTHSTIWEALVMKKVKALRRRDGSSEAAETSETKSGLKSCASQMNVSTRFELSTKDWCRRTSGSKKNARSWRLGSKLATMRLFVWVGCTRVVRIWKSSTWSSIRKLMKRSWSSSKTKLHSSTKRTTGSRHRSISLQATEPLSTRSTSTGKS